MSLIELNKKTKAEENKLEDELKKAKQKTKAEENKLEDELKKARQKTKAGRKRNSKMPNGLSMKQRKSSIRNR